MAKPITTHFRCGPQPGDSHPDEWMIRGLVDTGEDQAAEIEAADKLDRLMCDCCQAHQASPHDLTRSGPDMLCDPCAEL